MITSYPEIVREIGETVDRHAGNDRAEARDSFRKADKAAAESGGRA